jgi:hypothetical protein
MRLFARRVGGAAFVVLSLVLVALMASCQLRLRARVQELETALQQTRDGQAPAEAPVKTLTPHCQAAGHLDIQRLRNAGLQNPVADLLADLARHPDLIPFKGIQGSAMRFGSTDEACVLTGKWVFAGFDDGHINGHMLLEYGVASGGAIHWHRLAAYLE